MFVLYVKYILFPPPVQRTQKLGEGLARFRVWFWCCPMGLCLSLGRSKELACSAQPYLKVDSTLVCANCSERWESPCRCILNFERALIEWKLISD